MSPQGLFPHDRRRGKDRRSHPDQGYFLNCGVERRSGWERRTQGERRWDTANSTYVIVELVGTSAQSWEDAAKNALKTASGSIKELRVAEVTKMDMTIDKGNVTAYRARITVSFKYLKEDR